MKRLALAFCVIGSTAIADNPPAKSYKGLGAESVTAAEIARFAAPPLDPAVSRRIEAMLDVRGAPSGAMTSRGDRVVFTSNLTGTFQVWRQDGPMKWPTQLTAGEDRTQVSKLSPDDSFVAVSRDVGGQENPGLYLLSLDGGPLRLVQHTPKVQVDAQFISDDSKTLVYTANDIEPASYAIYKYDVKAGKRELVFDTPGLWRVVDQRGDQWLLVKALGNTQQEIYTYDVGAKKLTPLLGQGEVEEYEVRYGAKPGQVLVRTNKLGDFQRAYSFEGGKLTPFSPEMQADIVDLAIDHARQRVYLTVGDKGYVKVLVFDAKTLRPIALPALEGAAGADSVRVANVSRNGRFATFAVEGARLPPQQITLDWQTRRTTAWRQPMTPEIDVKTFATNSLEYYPARDGTKIPMFVRRPARCDGPCPVVVKFHGGPESQSAAGFGPQQQLFVDAGFVFVEPNVRGSSGYGKAWLNSDNGPKRMSVVTDIEDCAKFIRASWGKDGKAPRIGVMGGSYGGYASLMAMTYFAGAYDVGVQEVGISNLTTFLMNTAPYRRILRISEYGDPVKDKEALVQLSPITHVKKIKAPLLSIQGVNDPRVPVGEALQIYKELEARKIPGGLILFGDEGHGTVKRGNRVLAVGHTIAFFEKHLKAK